MASEETMVKAALPIVLPREARKALEYFETEGTPEDRQTLADDLVQAILACRWRAASRHAIESARRGARVPTRYLTEDGIVELAVKATKKRSSATASRRSSGR
jgi:hypothetical protein